MCLEVNGHLVEFLVCQTVTTLAAASAVQSWSEQSLQRGCSPMKPQQTSAKLKTRNHSYQRSRAKVSWSACASMKMRSGRAEAEKERVGVGGVREMKLKSSSTFFGDLHLLLRPARRLSSFNRACSDTHSQQRQWAELQHTTHLAPSLSPDLHPSSRPSLPPSLPPSVSRSLSLPVLNCFLSFALFPSLLLAGLH